MKIDNVRYETQCVSAYTWILTDRHIVPIKLDRPVAENIKDIQDELGKIANDPLLRSMTFYEEVGIDVIKNYTTTKVTRF